jgi:hypothetical protein
MLFELIVANDVKIEIDLRWLLILHIIVPVYCFIHVVHRVRVTHPYSGSIPFFFPAA